LPKNYIGDSPPEGSGLPTVQELLTDALRRVLGHPVNLLGSSRTDAGVHAKGQVAQVDTDQAQIPLEGLRRAVNARLPDDIVIRSIEAVADSFHAIRSTTSKRYQYAIWNALDRSPFFGELAWHRWQTLDVDAMSLAAARLVGTRDFSSFAKPGHARLTTVRTVLDCSIAKRGSLLVVGVEGTGFLWNMVRIMVGTLVEVGLGKYTPDDISAMLLAKDRRCAGSTAPAQGLYLQWVKFGGNGLIVEDHSFIVNEDDQS